MVRALARFVAGFLLGVGLLLPFAARADSLTASASTVYTGDNLTLTLSISQACPSGSADFYVNGSYFASASFQPAGQACYAFIAVVIQDPGDYQFTVLYPYSDGKKSASVIVTALQRQAPTSPVVEGPFDPNDGLPPALPPVVKSVTPSGTSKSFNLSTILNFDPSIKGKQGSIFVGAYVPKNGKFQLASKTGLPLKKGQDTGGSWYVQGPGGWNSYQSGPIPAAFTGTLDDLAASLAILQGVDISKLCGADIYVGYGSSDLDMLQKNTLGKIYTVLCNFRFSATVTGNPFSITFVANVDVATLDNGKQGNYYVAALAGNNWYYLSGGNWVFYNGNGTLPVFDSGPLSNRTFQLLTNANMPYLIGSGISVYVGYGLNQDDHLKNHKYGQVYVFQ